MYLDELQKLKHSNDGGDEQFYETAENVGRGLRSYTLHLPKLYKSPLQDEHGHGHGHGHGEKKSKRDNGDEHGHGHELSEELAVLPPLGEINTAPEIAAYVRGAATLTVCVADARARAAGEKLACHQRRHQGPQAAQSRRLEP
jgi:hypothetical protein